MRLLPHKLYGSIPGCPCEREVSISWIYHCISHVLRAHLAKENVRGNRSSKKIPLTTMPLYFGWKITFSFKKKKWKKIRWKSCIVPISKSGWKCTLQGRRWRVHFHAVKEKVISFFIYSFTKQSFYVFCHPKKIAQQARRFVRVRNGTNGQTGVKAEGINLFLIVDRPGTILAFILFDKNSWLSQMWSHVGARWGETVQIA